MSNMIWFKMIAHLTSLFIHVRLELEDWEE